MSIVKRIVSIAAFVCASAAAGAQVPVSADSVPSFERPNGSLMRTVSLSYALSLAKPNGQIVPLGTRSVGVADSPLGGNPAWLVVEARRGTVVETFDSVWVARADLSPLRWVSMIGRAQLGVSFTHDSAFVAVDSYQGRASFVTALPQNALLSAGMTERLIELLPLRLGYRVAATLMLVEQSSPRALPVELSVEREARVDIARRAVDCWLVVMRAGALEERLWVSKDGSRVVRTEQAVAEGLLTSTLQ